VQGGLRRDAVLVQHVEGDPLSVPDGRLSARVEEDLRVPRADGDTAADPAADVFFHLAQGRGLLRLSSWRLPAHGDGDAPVIAVCHGTTLTHPSPAGAAWRRPALAEVSQRLVRLPPVSSRNR
jgi:hypothetical protein